MSSNTTRLTASLEDHPRLARAVATSLVLLTLATSTVAAGGGSIVVGGP